MARATASSAADHDVTASAPFDFISGVSRRSSEFTDWKLKRPRSHNQPQFTGSLSTPWKRSSRSPLDWATTRMREIPNRDGLVRATQPLLHRGIDLLNDDGLAKEAVHGNKDSHGWAKRPRSQHALNLLLRWCKENDSDAKRYYKDLMERGGVYAGLFAAFSGGVLD